MSCALIVTGDDFGRSAAVNAAMASYHAAGALTQASLMVGEPHAEDAVAIAKAHPRLCVGLHLTLCDGAALAPSRLTDDQGRFPKSPAAAGIWYALDPRLREPLRAEIRRQFDRFGALGFPPTYWDGHAHLHLHPTILRLTVPIAREFGFRFVRLVREPGSASVLPWIFDRLSEAAIAPLMAAGIRFADRVYGLRRTGRVDAPWLDRILRENDQGVTELYYHPGAEPLLPTAERLAALLRERRQTLVTTAELLRAGSRNGAAQGAAGSSGSDASG
jgi:hopanoid biosynthesis associated protein HpnK